MDFTLVKKSALALSMSFLIGQANAGLIEVLPVSYEFDQPTSKGAYTYHDTTGNKLTDGIYGGNDWDLDLGNGHAHEWLGWVIKPTVNIDFTLSGGETIRTIDVGSVQNAVDNVVLPDISIYSRNSLTDDWGLLGQQIVSESSANNLQHHTYSFDGLAITDQFVRVQANWNLDGPWTFIDEVDFYTNDISVPEPSSLAIFALGALGIAARRLKSNK